MPIVYLGRLMRRAALAPHRAVCGVLLRLLALYLVASGAGVGIGRFVDGSDSVLASYVEWIPLWIATALSTCFLTCFFRYRESETTTVVSGTMSVKRIIGVLALSVVTAVALLPVVLIHQSEASLASKNRFYAAWMFFVLALSFSYHAMGFYPHRSPAVALSAALRVPKRNLARLVLLGIMLLLLAVAGSTLAEFFQLKSLLARHLVGSFMSVAYMVGSTTVFFRAVHSPSRSAEAGRVD